VRWNLGVLIKGIIEAIDHAKEYVRGNVRIRY
jgi:hypothetical protein